MKTLILIFFCALITKEPVATNDRPSLTPNHVITMNEAENSIAGNSASVKPSGRQDGVRNELGEFGETHGQTGTRAYRCWAHMLERCENPNTKNYHRYGGRGIVVCDRWHKFENFLFDMGHPPEGHTINRKENDGNYEPGNCKWSNSKSQANNRSSNVLLTHGDQTMTVMEWSELTGLPFSCLIQRVQVLKWPVERALTQPLRKTV